MGEEKTVSTPAGSVPAKKVDESWKNTVEKEKSTVETPQGAVKPSTAEGKDSAFSHFLSTLAMQAFAALGEIPDPMTGETRLEPKQAKYLIDILEMLHKKTSGNLSADESAVFEDLLYQLRTKFVQKSQGL